jgi:membrane protease subunit HflK
MVKNIKKKMGGHTMAWDWEKLNQQQQQRGGPPPQMDELFKQFKNLKIPGGTLIIIVIILVIAIGVSSVFTIKSGSVGVIQRFGKYTRMAPPGLNFKLPFGIESVNKVSQEKVEKEEFGFSSDRSRQVQQFRSANETGTVSLMLTGDLNVAVVPWIVQYRIKDPYNYLFKVKDVRGLLRDLSEASMRLVVGDRSINEVISSRSAIANQAKEVLQTELDKAETGLLVVNVELKRTNVPQKVQPSFNEVNQAIQEKEKLIYQAREDYNKAIPAARGEADRTIKAAEGYALDRINRAKGDADRFKSLYAEYAKAKDVTKRRLYLEALKDLLPRIGSKYIIDANQHNLLPLLNIEKLQGIEK